MTVSSFPRRSRAPASGGASCVIDFSTGIHTLSVERGLQGSPSTLAVACEWRGGHDGVIDFSTGILPTWPPEADPLGILRGCPNQLSIPPVATIILVRVQRGSYGPTLTAGLWTPHVQ